MIICNPFPYLPVQKFSHTEVLSCHHPLSLARPFSPSHVNLYPASEWLLPVPSGLITQTTLVLTNAMTTGSVRNRKIGGMRSWRTISRDEIEIATDQERGRGRGMMNDHGIEIEEVIAEMVVESAPIGKRAAM